MYANNLDVFTKYSRIFGLIGIGIGNIFFTYLRLFDDDAINSEYKIHGIKDELLFYFCCMIKSILFFILTRQRYLNKLLLLVIFLNIYTILSFENLLHYEELKKYDISVLYSIFRCYIMIISAFISEILIYIDIL